jgi:hypothetical protein
VSQSKLRKDKHALNSHSSGYKIGHEDLRTIESILLSRERFPHSLGMTELRHTQNKIKI